MQRQRVTRRALLAVRSDDCDFAEWLGRGYKARQSLGEYSVVIGAENPHLLSRG